MKHLILVFLLVGCASQTREVGNQKWSGSVTIPIPTADGKVVPTPVPFRVTGETTTTSETKTTVDAEEIATKTAIAVVSAMQIAAGGTPWAQLAGGIGGLATVATTGYLALAKRDQIKKTKKEV